MRRRKSLIVLSALAALLALNAVLVLAQPGAALPWSLGQQFFGPNMVRAEVVLKVGPNVRGYRIDRGTVRVVTSDSVVLLERDGTVVTVPVAPNADVRVRNRRSSLSSLRRGMRVETIREGDAPAGRVTSPPSR
jgi:hypothetical protein